MTRLKSMAQALYIDIISPGLVHLLRKNSWWLTDIPSTQVYLDTEGVTPDNKESWLACNINAAIEGSSHWKKVREIIDIMDKEEESGTPRKHYIYQCSVSADCFYVLQTANDNRHVDETALVRR